MPDLSISIVPIKEYYVTLFIDDVLVTVTNNKSDTTYSLPEGRHIIRAVNSRYADYSLAKSFAKFDKPHIKKPNVDEIILASSETEIKIINDASLSVGIVQSDSAYDDNNKPIIYQIDFYFNQKKCFSIIRNKDIVNKKQKALFSFMALARQLIEFSLPGLTVIALILWFLISHGSEHLVGAPSMTGYQLAAFFGIIGFIVLIVTIVDFIRDKRKIDRFIAKLFGS